ncbi:hypothetical protein D3C74_286620 [compost metagenome]
MSPIVGNAGVHDHGCMYGNAVDAVDGEAFVRSAIDIAAHEPIINRPGARLIRFVRLAGGNDMSRTVQHVVGDLRCCGNLPRALSSTFRLGAVHHRTSVEGEAVVFNLDLINGVLGIGIQVFSADVRFRLPARPASGRRFYRARRRWRSISAGFRCSVAWRRVPAGCNPNAVSFKRIVLQRCLVDFVNLQVINNPEGILSLDRIRLRHRFAGRLRIRFGVLIPLLVRDFLPGIPGQFIRTVHRNIKAARPAHFHEFIFG